MWITFSLHSITRIFDANGSRGKFQVSTVSISLFIILVVSNSLIAFAQCTCTSMCRVHVDLRCGYLFRFCPIQSFWQRVQPLKIWWSLTGFWLVGISCYFYWGRIHYKWWPAYLWKFSVHFFKRIQDWILKSKRI